MATEFNPGGSANLNQAVLARLLGNSNTSFMWTFDAGGSHTTARPTVIDGYTLQAKDKIYWHNHGNQMPVNMVAGDAAVGVTGTMKSSVELASFTMTAAQLGTTFIVNSASLVTITVPLALAPLGGFFNAMQVGAGAVRISVPTGATINGRDNSVVETAGEGETLFMVQPAVVNTWFANRVSA